MVDFRLFRLLIAACFSLVSCSSGETLTPSPSTDLQSSTSDTPSIIGQTPEIVITNIPDPSQSNILLPTFPANHSRATDAGLLSTPHLVSSVPITPDNAPKLSQNTVIHFNPWSLVMAVSWSPDGKILAVSAGENIHLYDVQGWKMISSFSVGAFTHSLDFNPEGQWLAAGSRDGVVRVWNLSVDEKLRTGFLHPYLILDAHKKGVNSVVFSPDSRLIASAGNDAVGRFWDLATGEKVGQAIGGTFAIPSIDFSPNGTTLAMVNGDVVRLREVGSERITGTFLAETSLYSAVLSPDGHLLAAGDDDNLIRLWDTEQAFRTGKEEYPEPMKLVGHAGRAGTFQALIWQVTFSPDGRLLASAGGDSTIRLWDVSNGDLQVTLIGHTSGVTCVAFSPDGRHLVSGGLDSTLRYWGIEE